MRPHVGIKMTVSHKICNMHVMQVSECIIDMHIKACKQINTHMFGAYAPSLALSLHLANVAVLKIRMPAKQRILHICLVRMHPHGFKPALGKCSSAKD